MTTFSKSYIKILFVFAIYFIIPAEGFKIDFENLDTGGYGDPSHISVNSQYSDMGITFNDPMAIDFSKNAVISGFAPHSGSIAILQCYTGRCYEPIEMKFDPAVSFIRVWMGFVTQAMGGFPRGTTGVELIAYDANDKELRRSKAPLNPTEGPMSIDTPLEVRSSDSNICRATLKFSSSMGMNLSRSDNRGLALDDIEFLRDSRIEPNQYQGFGSLNYDLTALEGEVFYMSRDSSSVIPDYSNLTFSHLIYTKTLNVNNKSPISSFPEIGKSEWFAIRYGGKFNITNEGYYYFRLASDDGSRLIIDGNKIIDNDGMHPLQNMSGQIFLKNGVHEVEVDYFQADHDAALQLFVVAPEGSEELFQPDYGAENIYNAEQYIDIYGTNVTVPASEPLSNGVGYMDKAETENISAVTPESTMLTPAIGEVRFFSKPLGAKLTLDNITYGTTWCRVENLDLSKKHNYILEKDPLPPKTGQINETQDKYIQISVDLT